MEHTIAENEKETEDNTEKREDTSGNRNGFWDQIMRMGYLCDRSSTRKQSKLRSLCGRELATRCGK
jgi:hypothetical protein